MQSRRRQYIKQFLTVGSVFLLPPVKSAASEMQAIPFGDGELLSLSDGQLNLPLGMILPNSIDEVERKAFVQKHHFDSAMVRPDCNLTLWRQAGRVVLFDAGAGTQFQAGGGKLADTLNAAGIDTADITDVVFTHGHPDHLWGVIDDFNEVAFPEAQFHMPGVEWNYWRDKNTLARTTEARKTFVVGAQNRLSVIEERTNLFNVGDEVLAGVEAVDTRGHTPGHCSFALHNGGDSLLVVGDALANAAISFEKPHWPSGSDQDQQLAIDTRLSLLDRLSHDKSLLVGFHLPAPGIGWVERLGTSYRFVASM